MMHVRTTLLPLAALAALMSAPSAQAQDCEAPPGSAAVEQYCEAIPEGSGSQSGNEFQRERATQGGEGDAGGGQRNNAFSADTASKLESEGTEGAAVAALVGQSSRSSGSGSTGSAGTTNDGGVAGAQASGGEASTSPLKAVSASVVNGPVTGPLLIWALLGSTVAVCGLGWIRYRGSSPDAANDDV